MSDTGGTLKVASQTTLACAELTASDCNMPGTAFYTDTLCALPRKNARQGVIINSPWLYKSVACGATSGHKKIVTVPNVGRNKQQQEKPHFRGCTVQPI